MYTDEDIFVEAPGDLDLSLFAQTVFRLIGVEQFEERESANYVDGQYFRSIGSGVEIIVARTDNADLTDYRFWLSLNADGIDRSDSLDASKIALMISSHGWRCFIPSSDWARTTWSGAGRIYEAS